MPSARAIRAGAAYVELYTHDSKLIKGLKRAEKRITAFGERVRGMGLRMMAAAGTLALPFLGAVKAASDMQETMNKFDVVFAQNAAAVGQWGDAFAEEVGRSKKQVRDFLAGTQDLFVPLGFEPGAAEDMSKEVTRLAVDLASFNNMADADVLRDLHAALTGSSEVMKKYGVIANETAVKQEALQQGMDPKNLSEQQKVLARLSIILKGTTAAQGDAVRSAGSLANQVKRLRARVSDAAVEVGNALIPMVTQFVAKAAEAARFVADWASRNQELIVSAAKIVMIVAAVGAGLVVVGTIIAGFGAALGVVTTVIGGVGTALGLLMSALAAMLSPIGLVIAAVAALGVYLGTATGAGGEALAWLGAKFGVLKDDALTAFGAIGDALAAGDISLAAKVLWLTLKMEWQRGIQLISSAWLSFKHFFVKVAHGAFYGALSAFEAVWHGLEVAWIESTAFLAKVWDRFVSFLKRSWEGVKSAAEKAWAFISSLFGGEETDSAYTRIDAERNAAVAKINDQEKRAVAQREAERQKDRERSARVHEGTLAEIGRRYGDERTAAEQEYREKMAGTGEKLADARREWQEAVDAARAKRAGVESEDGGPAKPGVPGAVDPADLIGRLKSQLAGVGDAVRSVSVVGTFSGLAAQGLGTGSVAERTASATEQTAKGVRELVREARDGGLAFT